MRPATLIRRSLGYYWRTNLAVVAGVGTAVTVLAGALLVGDSVRASLRKMALERLGRTAYAITAGNFFRAQLAEDLAGHAGFGNRFVAACPLIVLEGGVKHEASGRQGLRVSVYGVDERFWKFHAQPAPATGNDALLSPGLAEELGATAGDTLLLRVEKRSAIPVESLHGRRDEPGRTMRIRVAGAQPAARLGEFALRPQQSSVRAVFVPLARLGRELDQEGRANALLVSENDAEQGENGADVARMLRGAVTLEDMGVRLRLLERQGALSLESEQGLVPDRLAETGERAARGLGMRAGPVYTYLANTMRSVAREVPYALVTALELSDLGVRIEPSGAGDPPIVLNAWAARELAAKPGERVTLEYYVWKEEGRLETERAAFRVAGIVPLAGRAADPDLAPPYAGITESEKLADWDPPFPIDLSRVRPRDEEYWKKWRTTPKAFISLEKGQALWPSRFGKSTSVRIGARASDTLSAAREDYRKALWAGLEPLEMGFAVQEARAEGLSGAQGAVNFGEYFLYFSFFLVTSSVLLTGLFFKLGIEQRHREVGLLRAVGFSVAQTGMQFLGEGALLAAAGSALGLIGAVAYGQLILLGLRTWWVDAVGTRLLELHVTPAALALGGAGGMLAAVTSIAWVMRSMREVPPRSLLTGAREGEAIREGAAARSVRWGAAACAASLAMVVCAWQGLVGETGGFFGAGFLLLAAVLCFAWAWLARRGTGAGGGGWQGVWQLGFRNATWRPGRSLLCVALLASATFILVAVEAFRRPGEEAAFDRRSGTGGFTLMAESLLPVPHDLNSRAGKEAANLSEEEQKQLAGVRFVGMRLRPGDDASCLNLYRPENPRILGVPERLAQEGRFRFQETLADTPEETKNPWRLLESETGDGAVPAFADVNSMTYILHLKLGEEFALEPTAGHVVRFRLVGALADSIFQGELLIAEKNFLRLFPREQGFRVFLIEAGAGRAAHVAAQMESALADYGFDVVSTAERLATFHRVENTYLSTFQALGGLGLLLGTLGLAAVLLRNVLERRRELALLRAVGYPAATLGVMVVAENGLLLASGVVAGAGCALVAILPAFLAHGGQLPVFSLFAMLLLVLATGLAASAAGVAAAVRSPVLAALRAE